MTSEISWEPVRLASVASTVVNSCLAVRPGDQLAVVADDGSDFAVVQALLEAAAAARVEATLIVMPMRERPGAPANPVVAAALAGATAIVAPTSTSLAFTPEFGAALKECRARAIVMTGVRGAECLDGAALADYDRVHEVTAQLARAMTEAKRIDVTCPNGSSFTASLVGQRCNIGDARAREAGEVSGFPSGEAWMVPLEGTGEGVLVADGSGHGLGILESPIAVTFHQGRAVDIAGGQQAARLRSMIAGVANGDNLGELSIGTNPAARFTGNITEDKKQIGTAHFALGNSVVGGRVKSDVHIDLLISNPTVSLDGRIVVADRRVV